MHPLEKRFPEDTDWQHNSFEDNKLHSQCVVRNLLNQEDKVSREEKIRLLQEYQKTHVTEIRKIPWRRSPSRSLIEGIRSRLERATYQITQVKDMSSSDGTVFRKDFTLTSESGLTDVVAFKEIPTCTCRSQFTYHCDHIIYVLVFVLKCPGPTFWQAAFLPAELEIIYRYSRAVHLLSVTRRGRCRLCFTGRTVTDHTFSCCGRPIHRDCSEAVKKVRARKQEDRCWICEDISEWDIDKYREQTQIPAATVAGSAITAATTTATVAPAPPTHLPPPGTASVLFTPTLQGTLPTGAFESFQNITFQQPYQKYSPEELRLADYQAGRRFTGPLSGSGVASPTAFGLSNFGALSGTAAVLKPEETTGSLFGSNSFGAVFGSNNTTPTTSNFGALNGTAAILKPKETTGSLFGSNSFGSGGAVFGSNSVGGSGVFGSNSFGGSGGLFGSNNTTPTTNIVERSIECKDKDNCGVGSSSPSEKKDQRDAQANDDPKISHRTFNPPHSSSSFPSSPSNVQSSCESAIDQQEILTRPSLHKPSPASKDTIPQLRASVSLPVAPLQRSTSAPPMSNQEPMRLELKQEVEQHRVGNLQRGVSLDFSPALAKPLSTVTSVQYPIPTTSTARARIVRQAGQTPVPSADALDSHNSGAIPAAITAQAATPILPGDIANVVDGALPVSNMDDDIHRRKAAKLIQKCRRLEKESARIGKHVKRGMKNVDKEYKLELKLLKEKHEKKCMKIQKKWEKGLKKLTRKRERLEEELRGSCLRTEV